MAFYFSYFLKVFLLSSYLFPGSSAKFNAFLIKTRLEQRILNETAIIPLCDYFQFSIEICEPGPCKSMLNQ